MAKECEDKINGYGLTRSWFDFAFENPDIINPTHTAMFCWFVELNNRMGWSKKFAAPASQTMAAIGLKSYNTYKKIFDDLVFFEVIKLVKPSKNQYTACVIALSNFDKALYKALDKALMKHSIKQLPKQGESTGESTYSINKQLNNETNKPQTSNKEGGEPLSPTEIKDLEFKNKARLSFENNACNYSNFFKIEWLKLLKSAKWKKKEQSAVDASLKLLMKYDEVFAQLLVEKAIAGGYQGVVFNDTDIHYQKYLNQQNGTSTNQSSTSKTESRNNMVQLARQILSDSEPENGA